MFGIHRSVSAFVLVLSALFVNGASAQIIRVLELDEVRADLKLTDEQRIEIQKIITEIRSEIRRVSRQLANGIDYDQLSSVEQAEFDVKFAAKQKQFDADSHSRIADTLSEEQLQRLKELYVQAFGPVAFLSGPVSVQLEITDEQKDALRIAGKEFQDAFREEKRQEAASGKLITGTDRAAVNARLTAEYNRRLIDMMLEKLTEEQRKKYLEMRGEPIEIRTIINLK